MTQGATESERQASGVPGGTADKPTEVPAKGWLQIAKRGWAEAKPTTSGLLRERVTGSVRRIGPGWWS